MTTERNDGDAAENEATKDDATKIDAAEPAPPGPTARPRVPSRAKAVAVLAAVFVLGGAAGGAVGRVSALRDFGRAMEGPPAEARARFRIEAMRRHLGLADDQAERVRAILEEADAERDRLMESCAPGLDDLRKRTDAKLREVLSDDQKKRLDELDARRGRHGGPPPWPPPGRPPRGGPGGPPPPPGGPPP